MNAGIAEAHGKYIARMDADDLSHPRRLEEQLRALEIYPQAAFCGVARYRITPGGKKYVEKKKTDSYYIEETWNDLMNHNRRFTDPSVCIEKEKVQAVGGYRTFQRSGMDVDLWLRVMEKYGFCITITAPLFGKGLEPGSLVFKPETALLNQVPRVLARQREEQGSDAVQRGEPIDLQAWLSAGLLKLITNRDQIALSIGACVTCLTLGDWRGASIYFRNAVRLKGKVIHRLWLLWDVLVKLIVRLRNNPYKPYHPERDVV
jgi:glycosyltransferase involved in cell wall biosynthesis